MYKILEVLWKIEVLQFASPPIISLRNIVLHNGARECKDHLCYHIMSLQLQHVHNLLITHTWLQNKKGAFTNNSIVVNENLVIY